MTHISKVLVAGVFMTVAGMASVFAQTQPVITTVGNGTASSCTEANLRTAITNSNGKYKPIIRFNCGSAVHTIKMNAQFLIHNDVTIDGGNKIILDGQSKTRHFIVTRLSDTKRTTPSVNPPEGIKPDNKTPITFMLANIQLINGSAGTIPGSIQKVGGSIVLGNRGILMTSKVTFKNNKSKGNDVSGGRTNNDVRYQGGAIFAGAYSKVNISESTFENNYATYDGGAIQFGRKGTSTVSKSVFRNNYSEFVGEGGGGAIRTQSESALTITDSVFEGNKAMVGGAIFNMLSSLTIKNSTFKNNSSNKKNINTNSVERRRISVTNMKDLYADGGAIYSDGANKVNVAGSIKIENSTFDGNSATVLGRGGAMNICLYSNQTATLNGNTIRNNKSTSYGGGVSVLCGGRLTMSNNTFTKNTTSATEKWIASTKHYYIATKTANSLSNNKLND